ncbi:DNA primase [Neptuniibacter sp. CAU 1671]|uniref:DNA primase n=1 Tax=Neptuniibacter sp. CAU 1671 TaxID=3032593 RepID=UPI0023DCAE81|nr:DNA primase [Neptuniibacter sp. CAU 1671]MDF2181421.1 DNA primase [Neptuniibacter sp. CAU 1671]
MAGRIPQHFIDDLLARTNIIDVLDGRVDKLKRSGKNYSGLCPFHKEKTPSFTANQDKQFYYCFGCGAGGNALGFLMEYEHLSFPEAVDQLAKQAGMEVPQEDNPQQRQQDQRLKALYDLLEEANQFYLQQLKSSTQSQQAVDYLKSRGLSGQIAKAFDIGFAPSGWDHLKDHLAGEDPDKLNLLEQAGMLIHNEERDSRYDRFRNRIMFPIRDQRGRVIGFGGRVLGDDKPKYLNSPETPTFHKGRELYGLYEARKFSNSLDRLLIVEGYMDVVGLAQYGIHFAVATLGTATTEHHLERMFKMVPEVIFCFDGDNAGREAARRALRTTLPVIEDGKEVRFLFLPEGEDPDSLVRQEGKEAFMQRLTEALPLSEFFFRSHSEDADLNSMDGRARFSSQVLPAINQMKPSLLQQMMLDRICELTHLSLEQIQTTINFHQALQPHPEPTPLPSSEGPDYDWDETPAEYFDQPPRNERQPQTSRPFSSKPRLSQQHTFAEKLVALFLHFPALAREYNLPVTLTQHTSADIQLLQQLLSYLRDNPGASIGQLAVDWRESVDLAEAIVRLFDITTSLEVHDEAEARSYLQQASRGLEIIALEMEISALQKQRQLGPDEKIRLLDSIQRLSKLKTVINPDDPT